MYKKKKSRKTKARVTQNDEKLQSLPAKEMELMEGSFC